MPSNAFQKLVDAQDACIRACAELRDLMAQERRLAIEFKSDLILENNVRKENALAELTALRLRLREMRTELFAQETLTGEDLKLWQAKEREWGQVWESLRMESTVNSQFLKHSLKNLEVMSDHLRRLLGILSTYTPTGAKVDTQHSGTVLQGSY